MKAVGGDWSRIGEPAYLMEDASITLDDCQDVDLLAMRARSIKSRNYLLYRCDSANVDLYSSQSTSLGA